MLRAIVDEERFQVGVSKSRILIADPDPDISQSLQIYFQANGHEVQLLEKAGDIIKTARQWQPNAILISTELTDKNPHQVCQQLLEDTLTAHIPMIMLLHLDDRQARLEALEAGVDDIVTKPIDIEELRLRVEAAIRLSTMRLQT
jgi:DNA-binding response OmpR family regulator